MPAPDKSNQKARGLDTISLKFNFYRDGLQAALLLAVILAITVVVQMFLMFHFANRPLEREYFTVDLQGRVVKQQPMSVPYLTESALLTYAARAVTEAYTFDADTYRKVLTDVGQYFTPDGHVEFLRSMQPQIKYVKDNVLIGSAVPSGTPVLSASGKGPNGVYAWKVKVPVVVTFRTRTASSTVRRIVTLIIVNRPTFETQYGVGISSFIAQDL